MEGVKRGQLEWTVILICLIYAAWVHRLLPKVLSAASSASQ